jgi:RNA polymerase sigma factor (sigma-70 family)
MPALGDAEEAHMTQTMIELRDLDDRDLISRVRGGDASAYAVLYDRHREPAMRLARSLTTPDRSQDLVSEAFAKVLDVLGRGLGPRDSFRAYLNTTIRSIHVNGIRTGKRESLTDDYEASGADLAVDDDLDGMADRSAIARAFKGLPQRWATVLWLTSVENRPLHEVGELMGMEPNAVAALSHRAREGLRQAYLADHLAEATDLTCRDTVAAIPAYVRGSLTTRKKAKVDAHLDDCVRCSAIVLELGEINTKLGALLAPLILAGGGLSTAAALTGAAALPSAGSAAGHGLTGLLAPAQVLVGLAVTACLAVTLTGSTSTGSDASPGSSPVTTTVVQYAGRQAPLDGVIASRRDPIQSVANRAATASSQTQPIDSTTAQQPGQVATISPTGVSADPPPTETQAPGPGTSPSPGSSGESSTLEVTVVASASADGSIPCAEATAQVSVAPGSDVLPGGVSVGSTICPQP